MCQTRIFLQLLFHNIPYFLQIFTKPHLIFCYYLHHHNLFPGIICQTRIYFYFYYSITYLILCYLHHHNLFHGITICQPNSSIYWYYAPDLHNHRAMPHVRPSTPPRRCESDHHQSDYKDHNRHCHLPDLHTV